MTNEDQLAANFPDHIDSIRKNAVKGFLEKTPEIRAPKDTMAAAFDWATSPEGWQFWNDLYNKSQ